jgi:mannose-6-phosphate isomerase-like protein (cupin superfamily)
MIVIGRAGTTLGLLALVALGPARRAAGSEVTYLPSEKVAAGFAKGMPLVEQENYKVHASRREGPGQVEVHTRDTDVIHVLTGTATFVTGGTMTGRKDTGPEELRGATIEGGETRILKPGDVIIVPSGTPHWFKAVPGPITYFTVKVRAAGDPR